MKAAMVQIWTAARVKACQGPNPAKALGDKVPRPAAGRVLAFDDNFSGPSRKSETPEALGRRYLLARHSSHGDGHHERDRAGPPHASIRARNSTTIPTLLITW
jgi:hypothetical protein